MKTLPRKHSTHGYPPLGIPCLRQATDFDTPLLHTRREVHRSLLPNRVPKASRDVRLREPVLASGKGTTTCFGVSKAVPPILAFMWIIPPCFARIIR